MSYEPGTHIDLDYLNVSTGGMTLPADKKSTFQEAVTNAYEVGTQFIFNPQTFKAARLIPVVFA